MLSVKNFKISIVCLTLVIIFFWLCKVISFNGKQIQEYPLVFVNDYDSQLLQEVLKHRRHIYQHSRLGETLFNNKHLKRLNCFNMSVMCDDDSNCRTYCEQPSYLFKCISNRCRISQKQIEDDLVKYKRYDCEKILGCEEKLVIENKNSKIKPVHRFPFINPQSNLLNPITFRNAKFDANYIKNMVINDAVICNSNYVAMYSKFTKQPLKYCVNRDDPILKTFNE